MTDRVAPGRLQRAWAVLSAPRTAALSAYLLEVTAGGLACRVALDRAGLRHLLVPASGETLAPDRRPSVLSCSVRILTFDSEMMTYVDIWCTEPDLHAEFDDVIDDLLDAVDGAAAPGATALAGLSRWRRLFRTRLARGLSAAARIGLFAELTVLRSLLDADPSLPVEVWTGPLGQPHDLEAPTRCLEIKATGTRHEPITINGIEQLDTHDGRPLDLLVLT
ncbi:MAG: PD-(D/E)XK motif protein, partial [Pseudonocardiaceae bacterium]